jgi:ribose transport system ATP-binding protein
VSKSFGVTKALDDVSFTGYFGEIHAIIGGNGCGKSTLAKVLAGVLPIDSGKVSINGHHPSTPKESRDLGVSMVFQEVLVADEASIVDNLFIGIDGFFSKSMSDKDKQDKARILLSELADEDIDPLMPAGNLPLSTKAWITIARGLLSEPDLLILDESSAALDFDSTERLFNKMRELRDKGTAIIIVTHRIAELVRISDRCTVMRDGKDVGVLEKSQITEKNLLQLMTGKDQSKDSIKQDAHKSSHSQVALRTQNIRVWPTSDISNFELNKGEIVGITGLDGHGQDDFVRILAGISTASEGVAEVSTNHGGDFSTINTLADAKKYGIAFVSGDRKDRKSVV